jgi:hypothetical protein
MTRFEVHAQDCFAQPPEEFTVGPFNTRAEAEAKIEELLSQSMTTAYIVEKQGR